MDINLSYADLVSTVAAKGLKWQHVEIADRYSLWALENAVTYHATIFKDNAEVGGIDPEQEAANLIDYTTKYAQSANAPISSKVLTEPDNNFQMQADAVSSVCAKGTTTTIDYRMVNHAGESYTVKYLNGAEIYTDNCALGDWAESQIVDIDNVLGYGANLVLKTYVRKKYLFPNIKQTVMATAPGAIPVGLYIRVIYHSVGTSTDPTIYINYDIEIKG